MARVGRMLWAVPCARLCYSAPHRLFHASASRNMAGGYNLDLSGKVAFVAGVSDSTGYGWAVAKQLANAGATIIVGAWPPMMNILERGLRKEFGERSKLLNGGNLHFSKIYPLDAMFSTPAEIPEVIKSNKRYALLTDYDIQSCAAAVERDYGKIDILVHALANGPEVARPLLDTSRAGYLAASSASAYSMVSMVDHFGRIMEPGGSCLSISFVAAQRVVPGYGGGMSSAKAQLESDTKVLAWEAGRKYGIRVNTISAGPLASRAASAINTSDTGDKFIDAYIEYCRVNAPLTRSMQSDDVGRAALALSSELSAAVTGTCQFVDNGMHVMSVPIDSKSLEKYFDSNNSTKPDV